MDVAPDDEQFLMIKEGRDPNAYRPRHELVRGTQSARARTVDHGRNTRHHRHRPARVRPLAPQSKEEVTVVR